MKRCRHRKRIKVYDWYHQSMGPQADAWWCPGCGALRRCWERRWLGATLRRNAEPDEGGDK